jgi:type I restriction enzyme S subunit
MKHNTKPSGIEWIGDIPDNWKMGRIKYCYDIILGKMLQPEQERPTDKEMDYMCSANITWKGIDLSVLKKMWFSPGEMKQYLLKKGDLLVTEGGDVAVSCFWNNEIEICGIQNAIHLIRENKEYSNKILYYWLYFLKHNGYIDLICNKATISHFTKEKFGDIPFCITPLMEQQAIASFLDAQCEKIDGIITAMEQQIEVLKQYKTSLITETVTKGLDKSVPMKDSGIEWIGKIPAKWKTGRIKYVYATILGKMLQPVQEHSTDKEMDYMCSVNVTWEGIDLSVLKQMWFSPSEIKQYSLKEGDLLVVEGGDIAIACIWKEEVKNCCIQNALHLVRKNRVSSNRFLYYWLYFLKHSGYIDLVCNKATIAHFTKEKFGQSPFCIFPVTEQNAIADFLDDKCGSVNKVISDKQKSIATMKSYKKSLIYEYVTGKKRVKT